MISNHKGFSLIELIVVIAIIAIMVAIAVPNMTDWISRADYRNASQQVLQVLKQGRSLAISTNREYKVEFDLDNSDANYIYMISEGKRAANSDALGALGWVEKSTWADSSIPPSVVLRGGSDCQGTTDVSVSFNPNGTSNQGTICIMDPQKLAVGDEKFKVKIANSNTGRVIIE